MATPRVPASPPSQGLTIHRDDAHTALLDSLPIGAARLDPDLCVQFCNRTLAGWLGQAHDALLGQAADRVFGSASRALMQQALHGRADAEEIEVLPPVGPPRALLLRYRPLREAEGTPAGVLVSAMELSGASGERQTRAHQELEAVQRVARIGTYHTDLKRQVWTASEGFCRLFGFEPGGVYTTGEFQAIVHPDELDDVMTHFGRCITERVPFDLEYRCVHRVTGAVLDVRSTSQVIYDADGLPERIVGIKQDITERRHLQRQVHAAQRLESIGRLAGGVAHDFNNVLTAMQGFVELASLSLPEDASAQSWLHQATLAGDRARTLVHQLLAFARRKPIQPRVVDLNETIIAVEPMVRRLLGEQVALSTDLAPTLWHTRVDPGAIEQVLVNLAVNARDAMPTGGTLSLETTNTVLQARVDRGPGTPIEPGEYAVISLTDSGVGMDPHTLSRVFEPFYSTKADGRGYGLGLATCFGLVAQAQGHITLTSKVGKGTTARIYLPRRREATEPAPPPPPARLHRGSETVLLVEDDADVRTVAREALEACGYQVLVASDGAAAMELLRANAETVQLLLTDMVMPGMSGRQLAEHARALVPALRTLFMSGYPASAIDSGGEVQDDDSRLLLKPFTRASLSARVRAALDT